MKAKYPSLYADLEPETLPDGTRGATVRCTASRKALGFVWWTHDGSTRSDATQWHYRIGAETGVRNTERNAVLALRDFANGHGQRLPFGDREDSNQFPTRPPRAAPRTDPAQRFTVPAGRSDPKPVARPAPVIPTSIHWGTPIAAAPATPIDWGTPVAPATPGTSTLTDRGLADRLREAFDRHASPTAAPDETKG